MFAVGIDSGTQGTKALVIDFNGKVLGRGYAPHRFTAGLKPGESEQHPGVWVEALKKALAGALREAKINPKSIISLGISGQQHGFVPLDKKGVPIRPAKLWNDTSTVEETGMIVENLGGKKSFIRKLGISLAVGYTASKILWLKRNEPQNFARLATIHLPHNYLNFWLTGVPAMEFGDASGTGLMNIRRRCWHPEAIAAIDSGLEAKLPPLRHPAEPIGYIKKEIAFGFGMEKVLVSSGGGDNMMAAIGTGNVVQGVCTLSLGTSGTIYSYSARPFTDPEGEIAAFCDSTGGWLPLLCTMNVTNTTEFFKAILKLSNKSLEALATQAPSGAGGLIFLPFLDGERVPVLPFATGVFFGLNKKTFNAACLARSIIEGTILNLGYGFARMQRLGLKPSEIRATGGGARSRLWLQIVADVFKVPVVTLAEQEAAAFGAALQSIWSYERERGGKTDIASVVERRVKLGKATIEPQKKNSSLYDDLQERFNSLWKTLASEFEAHRTPAG
ncbi:MAG: xylulokinase [Clostridiales bacterium]|nr:xylulokinase [Clostridiales bacterium]